MDQDEYISIAEFARRAGVTPQAVYKQLNNQVDNQLSTYVKIHNGKKRIHIKALELFLSTGVNRVDNQFNNQVDNFSQPVDNQVDNQTNQVIDFLKDQIKRKDIQIEQLQDDLRTSRADNQRLALEMAKIADQGQQLQLRMMLPGGQQPEEPGAGAAPIQDADVVPMADQEEQHPIDRDSTEDGVIMEGRLDGMPDTPSSINWWRVVAIVAIIALIAGVVYHLWDLGYI
jgi:hypothetical protein